MKAKLKILSSLLALTLVVGLMPLPAYAAGQPDEGEIAEAQKSLLPQATVNHGEIAFGKSYDIPANNSDHRYTFTLSAASKVTFSGITAANQARIDLLNAAEKHVWYGGYSYSSVTGSASIYDSCYLNAGKYSFDIQTYGAFKLSVTAAKTDVSFQETQGGSNNTEATATKINLGTTYRGQYSVDERLTMTGITDFYRFTVPSKCKITIDFASEMKHATMMHVERISDNGKMCSGGSELKGNVQVLRLSETFPAGEYSILVEPFPIDGVTNCGGTYTISVNAETLKVPMHRMFNKVTGEHFYTASDEEKKSLTTGQNAQYWKFEGDHWSVPAESSTPVYRLCNPITGDHHFTMDRNEYLQVKNVLKWHDEGIGWYSEEPSKGTRLMRLNNPKLPSGAHHYVINPAERDQCKKNGWIDEGYAWYVCK